MADPHGAKIVDLQRYRLARLIRAAGRQQGELAQMMRAATRERAQLANALNGAQRHLARIADSYKVLLGRLEQERDFREACQEAAELDDLEEMIRRRDALARQLDVIRRDSRPPAAGTGAKDGAKDGRPGSGDAGGGPAGGPAGGQDGEG